MAVTLIYGGEPYLINQKKTEILSGDGFFHHQEFSSDTIAELWTQGFFGGPKGLVEVDSVKSLDKEFFYYLENPNPEACLVVVVHNMDERTKTFKELSGSKKVQLIKCSKLDASSYHKFLTGIISAAGKVIGKSEFYCLTDRLNYEEEPQVSLYTCENILHNIIAVCEKDEITKELIDQFLPEKRVLNKFGVAGLLDSGREDKLYEITDILTQEEGVIPFLSLLMWEFRVSYKARYFTPQETGVRGGFHFTGWGESELVKAMDVLSEVISGVKNTLIPETVAISYAFAKLLEIRKTVGNHG